jgi:hypothetical protein
MKRGELSEDQINNNGDDDGRDLKAREDDNDDDKKRALEQTKTTLARTAEGLFALAEELRSLKRSSFALGLRLASVDPRPYSSQAWHSVSLHHHNDGDETATWPGRGLDPSWTPPGTFGFSSSSSSTSSSGSSSSAPSPPSCTALCAECESESDARRSFDSELEVLRSSLRVSPVLDELRERLPFLRDYGLSPKEFAVSDLRYVHLHSQPS